MEHRLLDRVGAVCGIPAVMLSPVGFGLIAGGGFGGGPDMPREEVARAVAASASGLVYVGAVLDVLGALFFVVFAARMYGLLRRAEDGNGGDAWVSVVAFGAALLSLAGSFVDKAGYLAIGARLGRGLDAAEAVTLLDLGGGAFLLSQVFMGGLFTGAVAVVVLRTGVLPGWLAWPAALIALGNLAAVALPAGAGFAPFASFIGWVLVLSGYLAARPAARIRPVPLAVPA